MRAGATQSRAAARRRLAPLLAAALTVLAAPPARAQSLAARAQAAAADQDVSFAFPARADVCGYGSAIIRFHEESPRGYSAMYVNARGTGREPVPDLARDELRVLCDFGPVRVTLRRAAGRVTDIGVRVGGAAPAGGLQLGEVPAAEAVGYLLAIARAEPAARGRDALFPVYLAEGEQWPRLLELARDRDLDGELRKHAIFWLAQAAGDRATVGLRGILADDSEEIEVRNHAVFALSQLPSDDALSALIDIAESATEPAIRRHALFWLGQKGDEPRVLALFERILLTQRR